MLCECGCGEPTKLSQRTQASRGAITGQPQRYIKGHNPRKPHVGPCPNGHDLAVGGRYRGQCMVCRRANTEAWHAAHPGYAKIRGRRKTLLKYGLDEAQYQALVDAQGGRCAICRQAPTLRRGVPRLSIDHDHQTGRVRGLLCYNCNWSLGKFRDSAALLRRAADYLDRSAYQVRWA